MVNSIMQNTTVKFALSFTLVAFVIYLCYLKYQKIVKEQELEPIFIRSPLNAKKPSVHSNQMVPLPRDGTGYSMSVWLWVDDWDYRYGEWKHILHKGSEDANSVQPGIWLHPKKNELYVKFDRSDRPSEYGKLQENKTFASIKGGNIRHQMTATTVGEVKKWCNSNSSCQGYVILAEDPNDDSSPVEFAAFPDSKDEDDLLDEDTSLVEYAKSRGLRIGVVKKGVGFTSMDPSQNKEMIVDKTMSNNIDNIPMGRWFHLCVVVSNQSTDIYVDGQLRNTTTIETDMKQNNGQLWVTQGGGFSGLITQLRYYDTSIPHPEVGRIYSWGPNPWMWPDIVGLANKYKGALDVNVNINVSGGVGDKQFSTESSIGASGSV